ncbi:MAG: ribonuclease HII, partial [Ignisphaera sp.]|nr:ribonuclease HII [Ignisphaera sp.]
MNNQKLLVAGVDEAGRGPLIGDMFMAIVVVEEEKLRILEQLGVRDSKKLTREKREKLLPLILSIANFVAVHRITPDQIDKYNINLLELESLVKLVKLALTFHPVKRVFIDAFTNPTTITSALHTIKDDIDVIAEYNADSKYIAVSSASIVAKVLRDWHIDQLK